MYDIDVNIECTSIASSFDNFTTKKVTGSFYLEGLFRNL